MNLFSADHTFQIETQRKRGTATIFAHRLRVISHMKSEVQ
jgi:hypothetical protein